MQKIALGRVKEIPNTGILYDSLEELKQLKGDDVVVWNTKTIHPNKEIVKVGDYFQYDDGKVAEILLKIPLQDSFRFRTIMNGFHSVYVNYTKLPFLSTVRSRGGFSFTEKEDDLTKIDLKKEKFVQLWLFAGESIEDAVRGALYYQFRLYYKRTRHGQKVGPGNKAKLIGPMREYGRRVISGPWFDKLLAEDRVVRDRYMSFVGTLDAVGLTREKIAEKVKEALVSENAKERINALNRVLEMIAAEDAKNPKRGAIANAQYQDVSDEVSHLSGSPQKALPPITTQEVPIHASPETIHFPGRETVEAEAPSAHSDSELVPPLQENRREPRTKEEYHSLEEAVLTITEEEIRNASAAKAAEAERNKERSSDSPKVPEAEGNAVR